MKKVVLVILIYSVAFMGFATTTQQGPSLNAYSTDNQALGFDTLPFGTELEAEELAQVEGEGRVGAAVVTYVVTEVVENIPTKGGKSTVGKDIDEGIQKGYKAADRNLTEHAKETGRKCGANPRRCAD